MFLYDNMIKAELQTEDGFMIVSMNQEPDAALTHVKTEPEDIENYASHMQNIKPEIKTEQIEVKGDDDMKNEHEDCNLDRRNVCNKLLTVNQSHGTVSESKPKYLGCGSLTLIDADRNTDRQTDPSQSALCNTDNMNSSAARRNPSRSAKRNTVYRENDCGTMADSNEDGFLIDNDIQDHYWKCGEFKSNVEENTGMMEMDNLSESDSISHQQSGEPYKATQSGHLKDHLTHTREKNFKCDICDKRFIQSSYVKLHIRTVHDKFRAFPCPYCSHEAIHSSNLKNHILTHTREKNFKCDICEKMFTLKTQLKMHIRTIHDKIRAFPCPHCPYKATQSSSLKNHLFTHNREKKFKCDICEKKFTLNTQLKMHIKTIHDKIRAFPCPRCPYKAMQSINLKQHIRGVHNNIRPYPCPCCPYKAVQLGHLKRHLSKHTREKNFKCDDCEKKFAESSNLKRHIKSHCRYRATQSGSLKI